ncbi:hypothetical protein AGLY_000813 [Aphis glycines]|uniref:Uncharacterized protein n=1 Tax=Aphis glycines TaxID=307491 RepID=A0A6G0U932_APHGL|nr:hypothetical protein AGLY_000813 [Aphis glycines]
MAETVFDKPFFGFIDIGSSVIGTVEDEDNVSFSDIVTNRVLHVYIIYKKVKAELRLLDLIPTVLYLFQNYAVNNSNNIQIHISMAKKPKVVILIAFFDVPNNNVFFKLKWDFLTSVHPITHPFILRHIPQKNIFTTPPTYTILLFKIYTFRKDHSVMSKFHITPLNHINPPNSKLQLLNETILGNPPRHCKKSKLNVLRSILVQYNTYSFLMITSYNSYLNMESLNIIKTMNKTCSYI